MLQYQKYIQRKRYRGCNVKLSLILSGAEKPQIFVTCFQKLIKLFFGDKEALNLRVG